MATWIDGWVKKEQKRINTMKGIMQLAETDPTMKDLLDKAEVYYVLKGSPKYRQPAIKGTDYPGPG